MASNVKFDSGGNLRRELTVGASQVKGSTLLLSQMPVFLLENSDSSNLASCILPGSLIVEDVVTGANVGGNSAVAIGDRLYKDGTEINKDVTNGVFIGFALATVASGGTGTIQILWCP